ncbi:hypothetical protein HYZ99_05295 [Candidatus Peregrinibacteria bacterium]|nr:hypothetical protein [Candidatus Peregrinibacteria bacterium]
MTRLRPLKGTTPGKIHVRKRMENRVPARRSAADRSLMTALRHAGVGGRPFDSLRSLRVVRSIM